ncbi:MAG: ATP-grasp domain-containing protein [Betaproteobacteria bacterium]
MYLLEHDAKSLLAAHHITIPPGCLVSQADQPLPPLPAGPWMVKGQISAGGRGKAGIIKKANTVEEIKSHCEHIIGRTVKGHRVQSVRIEQQISGGAEAYCSLLLDAAAGGIRVIMATQGGMEIETLPPEAIQTAVAAPTLEALTQCIAELTAHLPAPYGQALSEVGLHLAKRFLDSEALLIEINPLFVRSDSSWVVGDAKYVTDDSALERQAEILQLLKTRASAYPEAALKFEHGCDYVVVDPDGEIGLLTTGAGLSMMLVDELRAVGLKPYNFLDVRTGGLRGETQRLVKVLQWIHQGRHIKVLLINIFAGITELGEFSKLLVSALAEVPELNVPVVARLVGNGLPAAREVLSAAGIALYPDLDEALVEVKKHLAAAGEKK